MTQNTPITSVKDFINDRIRVAFECSAGLKKKNQSEKEGAELSNSNNEMEDNHYDLEIMTWTLLRGLIDFGGSVCL